MEEEFGNDWRGAEIYFGQRRRYGVVQRLVRLQILGCILMVYLAAVIWGLLASCSGVSCHVCLCLSVSVCVCLPVSHVYLDRGKRKG